MDPGHRHGRERVGRLRGGVRYARARCGRLTAIDRANLAVIAALVDALRAWQTATGQPANLRPLREAVWFYWQSERFPTPRVRGKYPHAYPWSAAARAAVAANPRARLVIEHTVPVKHLLRELLDGPVLDAKTLAKRLDETLQAVVLSPEEDRRISSAGLAARLSTRDGVYARYQDAGIDIDGFAPLDHDPADA